MSHIHYNEAYEDVDDVRPVYLVVADNSEEFDSALRYAARSAQSMGAHIGILHVITEEGFLDWGRVEDRVKAERRASAELFLREVAARLYDIAGQRAILFLEEGERVEAILRVLNANPKITRLVLGGDSDGRNPGPLVKYFSGKGISRLPVPLTIVPDHIPPEKIDGLV